MPTGADNVSNLGLQDARKQEKTPWLDIPLQTGLQLQQRSLHEGVILLCLSSKQYPSDQASHISKAPQHPYDSYRAVLFHQ